MIIAPHLSVARDIEAVLELVPDAMVVVDGQGRIQAMNSLVQKLLEYGRDELIGQPIEMLLPARFAATHPQRRSEFAAKPRTRAMGTGMELAARAKSGREIPVEISLRPVQGKEGFSVCAAIRDVTERRAIQETARIAEQHLRFIVENSPDFALIQDVDLRYRWVSQPPAPFDAADYLGMTDLERVEAGKMRPEDAAKAIAMKREVLATGTKRHWDIETELDGQKRFFETVAGPLIDSDGNITGVASYTRDRTEQHRTLRALEQARAVAEQASARNARFLAIASHDLRQPVQALAMLLAAAKQVKNAASANEIWRRIDETMRSQSEMLDALLNMTKIESGNVALKIETITLADLMRPVQVEMTPLAAQRGLSLTFKCPPLSVSTDAMLFRQILRNLIGNAIKYTDHGGVDVECRRDGEKVAVVVTDTGIGIPESALANVFGEFQQIRGEDGRARGGVGLGLWIVRRLADQLGIQIAVTSQLGKGATFTVELPKAASEDPATEEGFALAPEEGAAESKRILLVDDDEPVRYATQVFLKLLGYHVTGVANLNDARDAVINAERFDLIISDFHLMDNEIGVDAIKFARAHYGKALPAIVVSGDTSKAVGEFKSWERTVFLNKPVEPDHLVTAMDELLGGA
jgi:ribonuclease P protein component